MIPCGAMRIAFAALCAIALAASAVFIVSSEKQLAVTRGALRDFDGRARETAGVLADLRAAQQAYVAVGQGTDYWMPKVDALSQTVGGALAALQHSAGSVAARAAIADGQMAADNFGELDRRVRGYLNSGAQLMAADIIFTEAGEAAVTAAQAVDKARTEERTAFERLEVARRTREVAAAGGTAALMLLTIIGLAAGSGRGSAREAVVLPATEPSAAATSALPDDDFPMRPIAPPVDDGPPPATPAQPIQPAQPALPRTLEVLTSVAALCTDIGRVSDPDELRTLLGRAAELLDATGMILWLANDAGSELLPALAHGYPPETISRIRAVPSSAANAAAAAYRSGTLQIVRSRPGLSRGALVAPVFSADGCIGVLSAEVRDGAEASDAVPALAAIIAAQFAAVVAAAPGQADARRAGAAGM